MAKRLDFTEALAAPTPPDDTTRLFKKEAFVWWPGAEGGCGACPTFGRPGVGLLGGGGGGWLAGGGGWLTGGGGRLTGGGGRLTGGGGGGGATPPCTFFEGNGLLASGGGGGGASLSRPCTLFGGGYLLASGGGGGGGTTTCTFFEGGDLLAGGGGGGGVSFLKDRTLGAFFSFTPSSSANEESLSSLTGIRKYKTCVKWPLSKRLKIGFHD